MEIQPIALVLDDDFSVLCALKDNLESKASFQVLVA